MAEEFKTPKTGRSKQSPRTPITIPPSPFMKRLGFGTGVNVYLLERAPKAGCYQSPWALKKVNKQIVRASSAPERLSTEAKILRTLNHPNIVGFRAFTTASDGSKCLAMEECSISLYDLIEERSVENIGPYPANAILKVAFDIAKALQYLHDEKHLLHGDMKSGNVLIRGDFEVAKLCDFGVSLPLSKNGVAVGQYVGTEAWSSKEAILGHVVTAKADIFPYGLTLWEMMALAPPHIPFVDTNMSDEVLVTDESVIIEDSDTSDCDDFKKDFGTRPALPPIKLEDGYKAVVEIFHCCTEENPGKRPPARDLVKWLEQLAVDKENRS